MLLDGKANRIMDRHGENRYLLIERAKIFGRIMNLDHWTENLLS